MFVYLYIVFRLNRYNIVKYLICYFSESKNCPSEDNNCYEQLMAMEMQSDLVLHNGHFECAVCLCTYDNNGIVLRDCLHVFCRYENSISLLFPTPIFHTLFDFDERSYNLYLHYIRGERFFGGKTICLSRITIIVSRS